jgi:hypothetical protein
MRKLIQFGFVIGLVGGLAAGYFFPWVSHARFPSEASVVVNGGRGEHFMIRLPSDLIYSTAGRDGVFHGQPAALGLDSDVAGTHVAHFKLRDVRGNVIGLAVRHRNELDSGVETSWLLAIPSRGSVAYSSINPRRADLITTLAASGLQPGQSLPSSRSLDAASPAYSLAATDEFADIGFELTETWVVSGRNEYGQLNGTIELSTIGRRNP